MDRAWVTKYDKAIGQTIRQAKQVPVLINYAVPVGKAGRVRPAGSRSRRKTKWKRFEKTPDAFDLALIEKIEELEIPYWFPIDRMPEGDESRNGMTPSASPMCTISIRSGICGCWLDYIFTDPPFGGNLMYSELNFLWEAWLKVFTNNKPEAIENRFRARDCRNIRSS
jgi:hypothetical protein